MEKNEMKFKALALIVFCLLFNGCATAPMQTPNPTNSSLVLPETIMIEGMEIKRGQAFMDCVIVSLESVMKFYGREIDRKIIDEIRGGQGTYTADMFAFARKHGFSTWGFIDDTPDKRKIKFYLAKEIPVFVAGGAIPSCPGHMVVMVGYSDKKKMFYVADPDRRGIQKWRYLDFAEWHNKGVCPWCGIIYPPSQSIEKLKD